ncbi:MAG: T9SS type A sorting domain-containing protein [Bacteroidetes bacterium]|nr:T9SS type A sorting domain-containing protein [Bacteroidota bacterium]
MYRDIQRPLKPIADFNYTDTKGEPGYEITFNDISKNNPSEWIWDVTPNTIKYMWGTNPGSQSVNIRFDSVGIYDISLRASNKGGYSDMVKTGLIEISKPVPSGIAVMSDEDFKIFPNPAQKELYVELPPTAVQGQIEIYSISGQLVLSSSLKPDKNTINIENLAQGTFVVKIKQGQFQNYRIFVKE